MPTIFKLFAAYFSSARQATSRTWRYTISKPPREWGGLHEDCVDFRSNFNADTFEFNDVALHALLDQQIAALRQKVAVKPHLTIWRIGEVRLSVRIRAGAINDQRDEWFLQGGTSEPVSGAV